MAHEIAKLLLEHAGRFIDRQEAINTALWLGMPLHEIEQYLDWLDSIRTGYSNNSNSHPQQRDEENQPPS